MFDFKYQNGGIKVDYFEVCQEAMDLILSDNAVECNFTEEKQKEYEKNKQLFLEECNALIKSIRQLKSDVCKLYNDKINDAYYSEWVKGEIDRISFHSVKSTYRLACILYASLKEYKKELEKLLNK